MQSETLLIRKDLLAKFSLEQEKSRSHIHKNSQYKYWKKHHGASTNTCSNRTCEDFKNWKKKLQ